MRATTAFESDLEVSRLEGERDQMVGRIERGSGIASLSAGAAVMAGGESAMGPGQVRASDRNHGDPEPLAGALQKHFAAAGRRRGLVVPAPGKHVGVVASAADPDELLHFVVVRGDVGVADGPGRPEPVPLGGREIQVRHPETHPTPDVGLAPTAPDTGELERTFVRRQIGLLLAIEKKRRRELASTEPRVSVEWKHVGPEP